MKVQRSLDSLHPIMKDCVNRIQNKIITVYNIPIRVFETGRDHARHEMLIQRGKTKDILSGHLYNLNNNPPLYAISVDYVVFLDCKWSWNLRDSTIASWYQLFGNLVLDLCPELQWQGNERKSVNLCHFSLKDRVILDNLNTIPCVIR